MTFQEQMSNVEKKKDRRTDIKVKISKVSEGTIIYELNFMREILSLSFFYT